MTNSDRQGQTLAALTGYDIDALVFTAEMYGVQLDQLAFVLEGLRDHLPDGELHWLAGVALS